MTKLLKFGMVLVASMGLFTGCATTTGTTGQCPLGSKPQVCCKADKKECCKKNCPKTGKADKSCCAKAAQKKS